MCCGGGAECYSVTAGLLTLPCAAAHWAWALNAGHTCCPQWPELIAVTRQPLASDTIVNTCTVSISENNNPAMVARQSTRHEINTEVRQKIWFGTRI